VAGLTAERLGQLLESLPPYELDLVLDLFRREQADQGLTIPKLAAISTPGAADARRQIATYRDEVDKLEQKLTTLKPIAPAVACLEYGL